MKKRKTGNVTVVMVTGIIFALTSAAALNMIVFDRKAGNQYRDRIENRYLAENSIDLAIGLFRAKIENQIYILPYEKNYDGYYQLIDENSPYILFDIASADNSKNYIELSGIGSECKQYYNKIGIDIGSEYEIRFKLNTFYDKDRFKLTRLSADQGFYMSTVTSNSTEYNTSSSCTDISVTAEVEYKGGHVLCDMILSNVEIQRCDFKNISNLGEKGTVKAKLSFENSELKIQNYQNYA